MLFKVAIGLRRKRLGEIIPNNRGGGEEIVALYSDEKRRVDMSAFNAFHILHEFSLIANYRFARYMCGVGGPGICTLPKIGR